jgi:hypothetical protein
VSQEPIRWTNQIKRRAVCFLLSVVCLVTASTPAHYAKKGNYLNDSGSLPAGTSVHIRMIDEIHTGKNKAGDVFRASLAEPVLVNGRTVAPKDAAVRGRLTEVVSSGRLRRPASITMQLDRLTLGNGRTVPVETSPYVLDGKSHALRNVALIGGGAAAGAALGGVASGKKGALIGSAIGAGAGTATAYFTGKQEIVVPVEAPLQFTVARGFPVVNHQDSTSNNNRWTNNEAAKEGRGTPGSGDLVFGERDRRIIRDYFRGRHSNLPPGLAKRGGNLPPGLEKQLQRNGRLPPGLQKRVEPFPRDLEIRLLRMPELIRRVILGRRALMLDDHNNVLDIIDSVLD